MKKCLLGCLTILFVFKAKTQTLQSVTTNGNTTTNDIYVNRILGQEANRSSIIIGTGNTYLSGALNGQSYIIGYHNSVASSSYQSVFGIQNTVLGSGHTIIGTINNTPAYSKHNFIFGGDNNVGGYKSVILGQKNTASNTASQCVAVGRANEVSNVYAYAFGYHNVASGYEASAFGVKNVVNNYLASAFGTSNVASGQRSVAFGYQNTSSGLYSLSFGKENNVSGSRGVAIGCNNTVTGNYAHAFGRDLSNNIANSIKIGLSNTAYMMVLGNGNVLIGKSTQQNNTYKLDVNGNVRANKVVVNTTGADFVFESGYKLMSLGLLEKYIKTNKHLPNIAPAKDMQANGVDVGKQQTKLLQKVEELTLYLIEQNKLLTEQSKKIALLQQQVNDLKVIKK